MLNSDLTPTQLQELKTAQAAFSKLANAATTPIRDLGEMLVGMQKDALMQHFPDQTSSKRDHSIGWMFYFDQIYTSFDDDRITIEYWEDGRCGNDDMLLHAIEVTEQLLTPEGREAYIAEWCQQLRNRLDAEKARVRAECEHKLAELEARAQEMRDQLR